MTLELLRTISYMSAGVFSVSALALVREKFRVWKYSRRFK